MPQPAIPPPPSGTLVMPPNNIPPPPSGTIVPANRSPDQMSAQPPSEHPVQEWLHNLNTDITEGGNRTLPGRILGHMQDRGDRGYSGLNSGGNAGTAQFMGSPVLGPIHAAQGVAETPQHPVMGPVHALEGVMQTGAIPGAMMGGEAAEVGIAAIPSRAHATQMFGDIENAAKDVPVMMGKTRPALGEFSQSVATGGKNAPVMTKLARRIDPPPPKMGMMGRMENELNGTMPESAPTPVTFPEARDFYTNISRATAKPGFLRRAIESPGMPSFRMNAGNVREALNSDLTDAAQSIGKGQDYTDAMNEYRRASQLLKGLKTTGKVVGGALLAKTGLSSNPVTKVVQGVMK